MTCFLILSSLIHIEILHVFARFMKLRLDRVLCDSFEADSVEEALLSNPAKLEFEKPENWVAPYPKYESGWWESFLYANSEKQKV